MFVYVGTFTNDSDAKGISVFRMDEASGALTHVQTVPDLISPSFVALHPQRPFLYTVERQWTHAVKDEGAITAFAVDPADGTLSALNKQRSGGTSPAYVSVHPSGRFAFTAHYGSGHVASFPLGSDGALGAAASVVQHHGRSTHPRQEGPHAHSIMPDPSGRFVLACDLGLDRVMIYRLDDAGKLVPNEIPFAQVSSSAGPRHPAFYPSGRFLYVINEIDSTISVFAYDAERGVALIQQTISSLPADFRGPNGTSQVLVHPNGKFVYGSNRGHDSIAIFTVDQETGKLALIGHQPSGGKTPRNFNIDPTGTFLLAGNQGSGTIVTFRIDPETGRLTATGSVAETPSPVCIVFKTRG